MQCSCWPPVEHSETYQPFIHDSWPLREQTPLSAFHFSWATCIKPSLVLLLYLFFNHSWLEIFSVILYLFIFKYCWNLTGTSGWMGTWGAPCAWRSDQSCNREPPLCGLQTEEEKDDDDEEDDDGDDDKRGRVTELIPEAEECLKVADMSLRQPTSTLDRYEPHTQHPLWHLAPKHVLLPDQPIDMTVTEVQYGLWKN